MPLMNEMNAVVIRGGGRICSVLIVGMPSPAGCDPAKTWRAAASFVERRLAEHFGSGVAFEYAELFSGDLARHPDVENDIAVGGVVPPIVVINGVRRFAGGRLNVSAIERAVAETLDAGYAPTPVVKISSQHAREGTSR